MYKKITDEYGQDPKVQEKLNMIEEQTRQLNQFYNPEKAQQNIVTDGSVKPLDQLAQNQLKKYNYSPKLPGLYIGSMLKLT